MAATLGWLEANWFNLVQTGALLLGLVYTGLGFARDSKVRRLSNLLALKAEHRELWNALHDRPELARVLDSDLDLVASPMTNQEEVFLRQMIVHFALAWELAWGRAVHAQDPGFSRFVADAVKSPKGRGDNDTRVTSRGA